MQKHREQEQQRERERKSGGDVSIYIKAFIDIVDSAEEHDKRYIKIGRNTAAFSNSGEILERKTRAPYREVRESEGR